MNAATGGGWGAASGGAKGPAGPADGIKGNVGAHGFAWVWIVEAALSAALVAYSRGLAGLFFAPAPGAGGWRNQSLYLQQHIQRLRDRALQPDLGDLDHAGAARHRPDDQPRSDRAGLSRHHRSGHPDADPRDRTDRTYDRGDAFDRSAFERFGTDRYERRRHVAMGAVPALPHHGRHGQRDHDSDRKLARPAWSADPERLGERGPRRSRHQRRAARSLQRLRARPRVPCPGTSGERRSAWRLRRRPPQSEGTRDLSRGARHDLEG